MIEVIFALACVAFILTISQENQISLDQQLLEIRRDTFQQKQIAFKSAIQNTFAVDIAINSEVITPPSCSSCTGIALKQVLNYELNQW